MKKYLPVVAAVICATFPFTSQARIPGFFTRFELAYSYVMASGTAQGTNALWDSDLNLFTAKDTTTIRNITASKGFGATFSTYIPLKRLGTKTSMALSIGLTENAFIWGNLNAAFSTDGTYYEGPTEVAGVTTQIAVPIGLDLKVGCDALSTKDSRFCATFGTGVFPSFNATVITGPGVTGGGGLSTGVNPYIKAEVGVFGGICWKFRATLSFGDVPYITEKSILAGSDYKVVGKSNVSLSFVIMPLSFLWKKSSWLDGPPYFK